jgi:predicted ATPase/DNA-binding NarL/FixJ family response regulator
MWVDRARHNLPTQLTSFVGRERELAEVRRLLSTTRLLTLVGAGGIGKTRLACQTAENLEAMPAESMWLVELAAVSEPSLLPTVAAALGVREQPDRGILDMLVDVLLPRRSLLLLDNCEHLVDACAEVAGRLLRACPGLTLLATSREPLGLSGETVWRVPPLSLPARPVEQTALLRGFSFVPEYEAVRLFVERAQSALPAFVLTEQNAPAVIQICRQLDGIPLAIELAAPLVRGLAPEQIMARLDDRFGLLMGGSRTTIPRHQTLRAAIDWSYDLLTDLERILFCRLSVFASGFSLDAAEMVCSGSGIAARSVLSLLLHLVDKSIVIADDRVLQVGDAPEVRYRLLESLRQYGTEKLREASEEVALRERHLAWCVGLAEVEAAHLRGPVGAQRITRLEAEHDNLRAALEWSLRAAVSESTALAGLRLAGALWDFWWIHGHLTEGRRWLEASLLTRVDGGDAARGARARALVGAGVLASMQREHEQAVALSEQGQALFQPLEDPFHACMAAGVLGFAAEARGDYEQATAIFDQTLAMARQAGLAWVIGWHVGHLGRAAAAQGAYDRAAALLRESLDVLRRVGDSQGASWSLQYLGRVASHQGDLTGAVELFEEGLADSRHVGDTLGAAWALGHLGRISRLQRNYAEATRSLGESLTLFRAAGDRWGVSWTLGNLGRVAYDQVDHQRAAALFEESLAVCRGLAGRKRAVAYALHYLGVIANDQGQPLRAARLLGAAAALREAAGASVSPLDRAGHQHELAAARAAISTEHFVTAWEEGQAMSPEAAVDYALASRRPPLSPASDASVPMKDRPNSPLSAREHDVAALIARGLTNRQIAAELVISDRTASTHVAHILNKLSFSTRSQIAAWAAEHGLAIR